MNNEKLNRLQEKFGLLYSVRETAEFFNVSDVAVYKWCNNGKLGTKIEGSWFIRESEILEILRRDSKGNYNPKIKAKNFDKILNNARNIH